MSNPSPSSRKMNILLTGAARGIGRALSRSFIASGHRVFLIDNNGAELQHTLSLLRTTTSKTNPSASDDQAASAQVDLADPAQIATAVSSAGTFFDGRLDLLINNAMALPHTFPTPSAEGGPEEAAIAPDASDPSHDAAVAAHWDRQLAVGLSAPFHLARLCVPLLRRAGTVASSGPGGDSGGSGSGGAKPGSIVNVSGTRARQAEVDHEGYSAAKAGLLGLSQALSVSLGLRYNIRVNSLVLGWIHVEDERKEADEDGRKWEEGLTGEDHRWHPAGRVGRSEDVRRAVEYLASADWVTGEEMVVDGGVGRRMVYPE